MNTQCVRKNNLAMLWVEYDESWVSVVGAAKPVGHHHHCALGNYERVWLLKHQVEQRKERYEEVKLIKLKDKNWREEE